MSRDIRSTELLLRSWYDWVPGVRTSTGLIVARGALPGEAATSARACPSCGGSGRRRVRGIAQPCERCGGGGELLVDAYTGRELPGQADIALVESIRAELALESEVKAPESGTAGATRAARRRAQEATVQRLAALERVRLGEEAAGDLLTAAFEARERQYEAGDYRPLERLMGWLREHNKPAHSSLTIVYVDDTLEPGLRTIGQRLRGRAEHELRGLATTLRVELRRPVRIPPWVRARDDDARQLLRRGRTPGHERRRRQRNGVIVAMAQAGRSTDEIAERTGLTPRRIRQVVASSSAAPGQAQATGTFAL